MAHLTCVSSTKAQVRAQLDLLREKGIRNILALRGDIPEGMNVDHPDYRYASELTAEIREYGGFCIGGACYPEGHPESATSAEDILGLKRKVEAGCQFLTTQMFFDNNILYNFMYRIREAGITVPVVAGIMPVTNPKQIKRICTISGNTLPPRFIRIVDRYAHNPAALRQAAVVYAAEQIIDLYANGINAVHVYSMNKPDVARDIQTMVSEIIR
jgi:methylenetetrahydrofolate reductase (NADPH)